MPRIAYFTPKAKPMKFLLIPLALVFVLARTPAQPITDPQATEVWDPEPPKVTPGVGQAPPSDAIVLFDGQDLAAWRKPQFVRERGTVAEMRGMMDELDPDFAHPAADWTVADGQLIVRPGTGAIETQRAFGSVQLHLEFLCPVDAGKEGQAYSNSGIFLMGLYEIQILNSYANRTYANGQAGAIYKQHLPLVNASRRPGEWQYYDILFTAPTFQADGSLASPARISAFHNGVLIQHDAVLEGPTAYIGKSSYFPHPAQLPLRLQDHGDLVRYRNIWIREL